VFDESSKERFEIPQVIRTGFGNDRPLAEIKRVGLQIVGLDLVEG
jgi:hypothetical protein